IKISLFHLTTCDRTIVLWWGLQSILCSPLSFLICILPSSWFHTPSVCICVLPLCTVSRLGVGWLVGSNICGALALFCLWKAHVTPAGYIDPTWVCSVHSHP